MSDTVDTPPRVQWVMLAKYCADSGDTPGAVHARRRKRQWIDGVHTKVDPNGNLRVCLDEVNRWIEGLPPLRQPAP